MIRRRYEVRTKVCATGEDTGEALKFFFRRNAEDRCWHMNSMRLVRAHFSFSHYVHDTKDDKK